MKDKFSLVNQQIIPFLLILSSYLGVSFSYGKISIVHIALLLATPSFIYLIFKNKIIKETIKTNWIFLFWIGYLGISLLWADNLGNGLKYLAQVTLGCICAIYIGFFSRENIYKKTLSYLLIATIVLSLIETFSDLRWPISKYSNLLYLFNKTAIKEDFNLDYPTAFFWTPNNLTYILLLFLPCVARIENNIKRMTLISLILFIILRASSRGILVLALAYLLYTMLRKYRNGIKLNLQKLLIITGISFGGVFLAPNLLTEDNLIEVKSLSWVLNRHINSTYEIIFENNNISTPTIRRLVMFASTVKSIKQAPVFGNGSGYLLDKTETFKGSKLDVSTPHFYWLEIMAHGGIFLLLIIFYWFFFNFRVNPKDKAKREAILLFIIGAPACSSLVYFFPAWLVIGLFNSNILFFNLYQTCTKPLKLPLHNL